MLAPVVKERVIRASADACLGLAKPWYPWGLWHRTQEREIPLAGWYTQFLVVTTAKAAASWPSSTTPGHYYGSPGQRRDLRATAQLTRNICEQRSH